MSKINISIHFNPSYTNMGYVRRTFDEWLENTDLIPDQDKYAGEQVIMHNCLLTRRNLEEQNNYDHAGIQFLDEILGTRCDWFHIEAIRMSSTIQMLTEVKKYNGTSLFIGDLDYRMKKELEIAKLMDIECIFI